MKCQNCGSEMQLILLPDPYYCKDCGTIYMEIDKEKLWRTPQRLSYDIGYAEGYAIGHQFGKASNERESI